MATGLPSNISAGVSAAGEVKDEQLHEPCSRCFHYAATLEGKLCVWGGLPDHHFEEEKAIYHHDTKSTIEVYDPHLEEWRALPTPLLVTVEVPLHLEITTFTYLVGEIMILLNIRLLLKCLMILFINVMYTRALGCSCQSTSPVVVWQQRAAVWCTMSTPWSCLEVMAPLVTFNQVPAMMADTLMSCTFIS